MTPQRDVFRLDRRSALVTGAGSGVGAANCRPVNNGGGPVGV